MGESILILLAVDTMLLMAILSFEELIKIYT